MNVTCPECRTDYRVDPRKVPGGGIRARCARCAAEFSIQVADRPETVTPRPDTAPATRPPDARDLGADGFKPWMDVPPVAASGGGSRPPELTIERPEPTRVPGGGHHEDRAVPPDDHGSGRDRGAAADRIAAAEPTVAEIDIEQIWRGEGEEVVGATPNRGAEVDPEPGTSSAGTVQTGDERIGARNVDGEHAPSLEVDPFGEGRTAGERDEGKGAGRSGSEGDPAPLPSPAFGSSDPQARARRLARALVSDIIVYNPDRRERSLRQGTVRQEFREEIRKSWEEYVAQVGAQVARETPYFRDALNELLAGGSRVF